MGLTTAQRRTLSRKAVDNSLEVEHLLKVATIGDAADAPFLRVLKGEHGWSDTGREGRKLVVPFGRWADTVCRFLEDGYLGLVQAAKDPPDAADFCVSVLEELKTGHVDYVTLTSSNIARALVGSLDAPGLAALRDGRVRLVTISPVTSAAVRELGLPVAAEAKEYTSAGVVAALVEDVAASAKR